MRKIFLKFTIIIWMVSTVQSAILECNWDSQMTICTPKSITPVTQPNEVITINGQPSKYVSPGSQYATFINQVINYLPTGLFTLFPNLQWLNIEKCETTTLTTDSIPNCGVLSQFTLRGGTFTNIPAGVLQSCKSLSFLGIAENNVTTVDVDALRGLSNLTSLFFMNSKISCIPPSLFQYTPLLSQITLTNNLITAIDSNLFANLPMLIMAYLGFNLISILPKLNFASSAVNSPNLQQITVDFNSNPIYAITPDLCAGFGARPPNTLSYGAYNFSCVSANAPVSSITSEMCQSLSSNLQNCYANWTSSMQNIPVPCAAQPPTTLPPTTAVITTPSPTPGSCPSDKICRYFLDQYNRYTCILDGVDSVLTSISGNHLITFADSNVRRVIFTNSFLSRIPPILFQKFTSLEYLTVSNCSMSAINTNTFTACGSLKYFDASSNFITTVDGASFKSCSALEVIDLTGNNFDMISGQLFVNNPTLKVIYINRPPAMVLV